MTTTANTTCDVFISHAASDSQTAADVAESLQSFGLQSFYPGEVEPGRDLSEAIWQALAECRAFIAVVSPETPTHAMGMVELGAATAWNKPVYLLINGPSATRLPAVLQAYRAYPINRLDEVSHSIRASFDPLSAQELDILRESYLEAGLSVDQLVQSPEHMRKLTHRFSRQSGHDLTAERLLSELLRLRKMAQLPRLRERA